MTDPISINSWCLRITWKYYDKQKTEVYLKDLTGFGALHDKKDENLHSHFLIKSKEDNKTIRNRINRFRNDEPIPKGFKPLTIQLLKTSEGQYYRYVSTKPESMDLWINGMDIPEFEPFIIEKKNRKQDTIIEKLLKIPNIHTNYYNGVCKEIIKYYMDHHKVIPMDGIFKQICRTVWLHIKRNESKEQYDKFIDKYLDRLFNDERDYITSNYDRSDIRC